MSSDLAQLYSRTRGARKIIVVDLGFLGDSVHLVPALWGLRGGYPEAELHVITSPLGASLLQLAGCVDRLWSIELRRHRRTLGEQFRVIRALRKEQFDIAFNFSGADRTIFKTALTGARWRIAYQGGRNHFWNTWLIPWWVPSSAAEAPVFERSRGVLAACGLDPGRVRFDLRAPGDAIQWARAEIPERAIHFSISASRPLKEWPINHWVELAGALAAKGIPVIATGSERPREKARLESFAAAIKDPAIRTYAGLPLGKLAAVLKRCVLHVGGDSGATQLAMGLNRPTVSLFRNYPTVHEWLPQGPLHRSILVPCECVGMRRPTCLHQEHARCLAGIAPPTVAALIQEHLQKTSAVQSAAG